MIDRFLYWIVDRAIGYRPPRQREAIDDLKCRCGDKTKKNPHWKDEHGRWPY